MTNLTFMPFAARTVLGNYSRKTGERQTGRDVTRFDLKNRLVAYWEVYSRGRASNPSLELGIVISAPFLFLGTLLKFFQSTSFFQG